MSKRSTGQIKAREEARKVKMAERRAEKKQRAEEHRAAGQSHALAGGRNKYRKTMVAGKTIVRTKSHPLNCGNMACPSCQKVLTPGQPFRPNPSPVVRWAKPGLLHPTVKNPSTGRKVLKQNRAAKFNGQWPETWGRSNQELAA